MWFALKLTIFLGALFAILRHHIVTLNLGVAWASWYYHYVFLFINFYNTNCHGNFCLLAAMICNFFMKKGCQIYHYYFDSYRLLFSTWRLRSFFGPIWCFLVLFESRDLYKNIKIDKNYLLALKSSFFASFLT